MTISCPYCQKPHLLPDDNLPSRRSAASCKGCGRRFILEYEAAGLKVRKSQDSHDVETNNESVDAKGHNISLDHSGNDYGEGDTPALDPQVNNPGPKAQEETNQDLDSLAEDIFRSFPELQNLEIGRFSLAELLSPNRSGNFRTRINILKTRMLVATSRLLSRKILLPGEMVCKIARGSAYFPFEIPYANGLLTLPNNYYALICTTHRLLLINLDFRCRKPVRYVFQILYDELSDISRGLFGASLIIKIRNGGKWIFTTVKRSLSKETATFIKDRINNSPSGYYDGIPRRQLCPACFSPLTFGLTFCPICQANFKSTREALKRSLLLPGMGEIYLGYYLPGLSVMAGYLLTWLAAVILMIVDLAGGLWGGSLLVLSYHLISGAMAHRLARKGYLAEFNSTKEKDHPVTSN